MPVPVPIQEGHLTLAIHRAPARTINPLAAGTAPTSKAPASVGQSAPLPMGEGEGEEQRGSGTPAPAASRLALLGEGHREERAAVGDLGGLQGSVQSWDGFRTALSFSLGPHSALIPGRWWERGVEILCPTPKGAHPHSSHSPQPDLGELSFSYYLGGS